MKADRKLVIHGSLVDVVEGCNKPFRRCLALLDSV